MSQPNFFCLAICDASLNVIKKLLFSTQEESVTLLVTKVDNPSDCKSNNPSANSCKVYTFPE